LVQLSILTIVGYGPWTLTLGSDREHRLQMLQASLYAEVQQLFSDQGCIVFPNRADELFAVSNGLSLDDHVRIQESLASKFDVRLRILLGGGENPGAAHREASLAGSKRDDYMLNAEHQIYGSASFASDSGEGDVNILHMDVDDLSGMARSPYDISVLMFGLYAKMSRFFFDLDSLAFFMGGDNFMIVASEQAPAASRRFVDAVEREDGVVFNCGVGRGRTGREAAGLATESLDMIRKLRSPDGAGPAAATATTTRKSRVYEHKTQDWL